MMNAMSIDRLSWAVGVAAGIAAALPEEQDGLAQDWSGEVVFCNPPYGRAIGRWVEKAFREVYAGQCRTAVLLLPARTETKWFHDFIYHRAEIRFIRGRIRFDGAVYNAPFPSMVVIFRGETA